MATAPDPDSVVDDFLATNGHDESRTWDRSYNKLQCPECGGLHDRAAAECSVCGWSPTT
ncbi:MAG: HVO_0416 family zinc finger protein [Halobacteriaceae archaeon]